MVAIHPVNVPDPARLAEVIAEMRKLGAPTIRVTVCGDEIFALEGSHRLAAAAALGIAPTLVELGYDDMLDGHDIAGHPDPIRVRDYLESMPVWVAPIELSTVEWS